ncbi:LolA family protein [Halobacterium zhouii]|uniref:LolA family protein n=1 Tax=Halobacterium zhouii TaxID=2902624 RepID=UPI001E41724F|nr:hypothetical protein [Halobacterium zhouii]
MASSARTAAVAVALAALLAASGCTALSLTPEDHPTPPTEDVEAQFGDLETLQATQVSTFASTNGTFDHGTAGNNTTTTRSRVRIDFTGTTRRYSRQLASPKRAGDFVVVNESATLVYDESENQATRIPRTRRLRMGDRGAHLARVVEAARSDGAVVEPADGVSPLPVVPATSSGPAVPTHEIDGYRVEYLGTRTVANRTAHGFRMTAVSAAAMDLNQTLWLDSEFYYPLRTNQTLRFDNQTMHVTTRLANVTFNGGLPDDAFQVDLPENATVNTTDVPETETFDSRAALAGSVETSVPDPDVPEGYAFERATHMDGNVSWGGDDSSRGNISQVSLQYTGDGGRLVVSKMTGGADDNGSWTKTTGDNVTVAGHDGRYLTTASSSMVTWSCDGHSYSVVATALDRDAILDVAASVACE